MLKGDIAFGGIEEGTITRDPNFERRNRSQRGHSIGTESQGQKESGDNKRYHSLNQETGR